MPCPWQSRHRAVRVRDDASPPLVVRVTRTDGSRVLLYAPAVRADTLRGWTAATETVVRPRRPAVVAITEVRAVEERTFALVPTIVRTGFLALILYGVFHTNWGFGWGGR
jgi:hypothetical protein